METLKTATTGQFTQITLEKAQINALKAHFKDFAKDYAKVDPAHIKNKKHIKVEFKDGEVFTVGDTPAAPPTPTPPPPPAE